MRRFLVKTALFAVLQLGIFAALAMAYRQYEHDRYLAATADKHARADRVTSPRIVFIGGSNLAFGLDSSAVRDRLGREPINAALHAGLGLEFILSEALDYLRPGDVAVVSLEFELFLPPQWDGHRIPLLAEMLLFHPASVRHLPLGGAPELLDGGFLLPRLLVRSAWRQCCGAPPKIEPPYQRSAFNGFGDVVAHHALPPAVLKEPDRPLRVTRSDLQGPMARLNEFHARCRARHVDAYLVFPPIPATNWQRSADALREIETACRRSLTLPLLNTVADAAWPREAFFDTTYHLTGAAITQRTADLLDRLAPFLPPAAGRFAAR